MEGTNETVDNNKPKVEQRLLRRRRVTQNGKEKTDKTETKSVSSGSDKEKVTERREPKSDSTKRMPYELPIDSRRDSGRDSGRDSHGGNYSFSAERKRRITRDVSMELDFLGLEQEYRARVKRLKMERNELKKQLKEKEETAKKLRREVEVKFLRENNIPEELTLNWVTLEKLFL